VRVYAATECCVRLRQAIASCRLLVQAPMRGEKRLKTETAFTEKSKVRLSILSLELWFFVANQSTSRQWD
jgi:hypothetical protein